MPASVTIYLTSADPGAGNFTIYHSSADPNNVIALNVSSASLAAGYCTNEVYNSYIVKSNTLDCQNQVAVYVGIQPTPTPTSTPGPTPTPGALPTLVDGWRFTAGTTNIGGYNFYGFHRGTLFVCPSTYGFGLGSGPTTSTVNLPGFNCYWTSILGANIDKGYGLVGLGAASGLALTQFSLDQSAGTLAFGIINASATSNPGTGGLSGTIVGDNGTSGTWSVNYSPGTTYVDTNGTGTTYTPESTGTLTVSGLTLTNGVTYNINV